MSEFHLLNSNSFAQSSKTSFIFGSRPPPMQTFAIVHKLYPWFYSIFCSLLTLCLCCNLGKKNVLLWKCCISTVYFSKKKVYKSQLKHAVCAVKVNLCTENIRLHTIILMAIPDCIWLLFYSWRISAYAWMFYNKHLFRKTYLKLSEWNSFYSVIFKEEKVSWIKCLYSNFSMGHSPERWYSNWSLKAGTWHSCDLLPEMVLTYSVALSSSLNLLVYPL